MNTNQLHQKEMIDPGGRIFPKMSGSLTTKTGLTKKLKQSEITKYFEALEKDGYMGTVDVVIEFSTEAEGLKVAKQFKRLAENPAVKLNVQFKNIGNDKN